MKLSQEQKRIAAQCLADIVRDAAGSSKPPSAKELKVLTKGAARALSAGFKAIGAVS
jgi:hypothetical protein